MDNFTYPFIVIKSDFDQNLLKKVINIGNSVIYQINKLYIRQLLINNGIDSSAYDIMTNLSLPKKHNNIIEILLVNTNPSYSIEPINYIEVSNISNNSIWKPVCDMGYIFMGYIVSRQMPSLSYIRCPRRDMLSMITDIDKYNIFGFEKTTTVHANDLSSLNSYNYSNWYPLDHSEEVNELLNSMSIASSLNGSSISSPSWETKIGKLVKLRKNDINWEYQTDQEVKNIQKKIKNSETEFLLINNTKKNNNKFYYIMSFLIVLFVILIIIKYYVQ